MTNHEIAGLRRDRHEIGNALADLMLWIAKESHAERSSTWDDLKNNVPEFKTALEALGWPTQQGLEQSRAERQAQRQSK